MTTIPGIPEDLQNLPVLRQFLNALRTAVINDINNAGGGGGGGGGDLKSDGSVPMAASFNLNNHKLVNVLDPTSAQDAATKNYVDLHDKFAATRIVDQTGVAGTDATLAAAVAALPASGGIIFLKQGTYTISAVQVLPNKDIIIVGAGIGSTIINFTGSASLFSQANGRHFTIMDLSITGDGITAGQTILTTTSTSADVYVNSVEVDAVNHIINDTGGTTNDFTFTDTEINLPSIDGHASFYIGVSTGTVIWNYSTVTLAQVSRIATGGGAFLGSPKWVVDHSYIGGPPPSFVSDFVIGQAILDGLRADAIKFTISGNLSQVYALESKDCTIVASGNDFFVDHSFFTRLNGLGGGGLAFITTSGCDEIHVANSTFDGAGQDGINGLVLTGVTHLDINDNRFRNLPSIGISTNSATIGTVTGNTFTSVSTPINETNTGAAVAYSNNTGLFNSTISGLKSLIDGENYRNIVTWGADPTGVIDSTTAIQKAVNSIPTDGLGTLGGELFMPPGKYKLSSTITLPNMPLKIIGSGDGTVINIGSNTIAAFTIPTPPSGTGFPVIPEHEVVFEDFLVKGNSIAAQKIVNINDSTSATIVRMVRVLSTAIQIPIFINNGSGSLPVIVSADDCYFDQLTNNSSILISTSASPGWTTFAYFNRVRFYHAFQDAHAGALTNGGDFSDFSNIDIIAEDSIFQVGTSCTMGSITMYDCAIYNGSGTHPTIHVEDDNDAEIFSQLTDCVGVFVNFDLNGNGTVFNGGFYNGCIFTDNAISYFTDCLVKSGFSTSTITGAGDTQIKGCVFLGGGTVPGVWIDGSVASVIGCTFNGNNATAAIRMANASARISDCRFKGSGVPFLETGTGNSRLSNNVMPVNATLIAGSNTTINGVLIKRVTGGTTTGVYVTQFTHVNQNGVVGIGTIKNTGVTNSLQVKETVTDAFGVTDNVVTVVAPSSDYMLDPQTNFATARPPYVSYAVAVQHPVAATTFDIRHSTEGAEE